MIRPFSKLEEKNFNFISSIFPEVSTLLLTENGLTKSIMDATAPLRMVLKSTKLHDYNLQGKGQDNKVLIKSYIWNNVDGFFETQASLYRPETKDGDPRIWFYGLKDYVSGDICLAIIPYQKALYVFNLATFDSSDARNTLFFTSLVKESESIATELLERLKLISREWIPSIKNADCSVGETLEQLLGIKQNSSKNPDYKGIELKSKRNGSSTRDNLFAQVPNWDLSNFKKSKEILDYYGYLDEVSGLRKLYVTVSALKPNPQGLQLVVNYKNSTLDEVFVKDGKAYPVVRWDFQILYDRLQTKHKETFWIKAESLKFDDDEFLMYTSIEHTKKPILENFFKLIETGDITLDHLIKEKGTSAVEKGPLFKLKPNSFNKLFPEPQEYILVDEELLKARKAQIKKLMAS